MFINKIEGINVYSITGPVRSEAGYPIEIWFMSSESCDWVKLEKLRDKDYKIADFLVTKKYIIANTAEFDRELKLSLLDESKFIVKKEPKSRKFKIGLIPRECVIGIKNKLRDLEVGEINEAYK